MKIQARRPSKSLRQNGLRLLLLVMLVFTTSASAQVRVVMDVKYTAAGMVAAVGSHLYLRVFSDGKYEFEKQSFENVRLEYQVENRRLSEIELNELVSLLAAEEIVSLPTRLVSADGLDYVIELDARIFRGEKEQRIVTKNFSPSMLDHNKQLKPFASLLCRIEGMRKEAGFSILTRPETFCSIKSEKKPKSERNRICRSIL